MLNKFTNILLKLGLAKNQYNGNAGHLLASHTGRFLGVLVFHPDNRRDFYQDIVSIAPHKSIFISGLGDGRVVFWVAGRYTQVVLNLVRDVRNKYCRAPNPPDI